MKLSKIKPNKANPRVIKDGNFHKLVKSLREFPEMMVKRPIVVDETNTILGGNMRYKALLEIYGRNGEIPDEWVSVAQGWSDEQKREFIIKDNAQFGEWDVEMLKETWDVGELGEWGVDVGEWGEDKDSTEAVEDDFDEETDEVETRVKAGEVWQLGRHRLMCGDSTDSASVARLMDGERADMLLTDPPYNVQYVGKTKEELTIENDRFESDADFQIFITTALSNAKDHLKDGGAFYIWTAQGHAMYDITKAADDAGLHFRQQLIWHKNHFVMGRMDYHGKHEPCLYGWKDGAGHYFTSDRTQTTVYEDVVEIDKLKKEQMRKMLHDILDAKEPTTILDCERPIASHEHPTMKPIKLMGMCITNSSRKSESVLDLFGGSGSTLIACEQLNRTCYMMELDPHYCDVIIARWEKLTGQTATKCSAT